MLFIFLPNIGVLIIIYQLTVQSHKLKYGNQSLKSELEDKIR